MTRSATQIQLDKLLADKAALEIHETLEALRAEVKKAENATNALNPNAPLRTKLAAHTRLVKALEALEDADAGI